MKVILRVFDNYGCEVKYKTDGEFDLVSERESIMPLLFANSSRIELECVDDEALTILGTKYVDLCIGTNNIAYYSKSFSKNVIVCDDCEDVANRLYKFADDLFQIQETNVEPKKNEM